ncbi:MAG: hypothetical protein ABI903_11770 [Actinomycetota bacterium]
MTADKPSLALPVRESRPTNSLSVFHAGVRPYMSPSLLGWVWSMVRDHDLEGYVQANGGGSKLRTVYEATTMNDDLMLDVVDSILQHLPALDESGDYVTQNKLRVLVAALQSILADSSSAYVVDFSDGMRLVQRVDETAKEACDDLVEPVGRTSGLLKTAWSRTFSRNPDPSGSYRDAVLAVESVACDAFTPDDPQPSLGKAVGRLRSTLETWTVATLDDQQQASAGTLLAMLETVWQNHQRHLGADGKRAQPATQDEAEAVLFLAVTIVQWFERGLVKKKWPTPVQA